jgi:hypothetical protein
MTPPITGCAVAAVVSVLGAAVVSVLGAAVVSVGAAVVSVGAAVVVVSSPPQPTMIVISIPTNNMTPMA